MLATVRAPLPAAPHVVVPKDGAEAGLANSKTTKKGDIRLDIALS